MFICALHAECWALIIVHYVACMSACLSQLLCHCAVSVHAMIFATELYA